MEELYEMIISHKNNITKQYDERLKRIIDFQIVELKKDISTINKKCEKAINMLTE